MKKDSLESVFVDLLRQIYRMENQQLKFLSQWLGRNSSARLEEDLSRHAEDTDKHVGRLEEVFELLQIQASGATFTAMKGIAEDLQDKFEKYKNTQFINTWILTTLNQVDHFEIALYSILVDIAEDLGQPQMHELLKETLDEEKAAVVLWADNLKDELQRCRVMSRV